MNAAKGGPTYKPDELIILLIYKYADHSVGQNQFQVRVNHRDRNR
ncbi:hypothetical protein [Desulfobacter postgatei]|nr:hypothetical protein [Desulfobacter postgatei]MDX9962609.1 hypothetical protein [Desulfobacter postgatei]